MKTIAVVAGLLVMTVGPAHAELLRVVDVASINQVVFAAYEDNQVWMSGGPPHQRTDINRDVPIKRMQAVGCNGGLLILYVDDQLYLAGMYQGFDFFLDAHRDGASVVDMDCADGNMLEFAYDDGQIWIWTQGTGLFRWEDLDRQGPTSHSGEGPASQRLSVVVPNPSSGACHVIFRLPSESIVSVVIADVNGRVVRHLMDGRYLPGDYSPLWDGRDDDGHDLPTGVYFTRIETAMGTTTGRVVLAR